MSDTTETAMRGAFEHAVFDAYMKDKAGENFQRVLKAFARGAGVRTRNQHWSVQRGTSGPKHRLSGTPATAVIVDDVDTCK